MSDFVQLNLNKSLGALLAGTWLNSGLYAIEMWQIYNYFAGNRNQKFLLRLSIGSLAVLSTLLTVSTSAGVYSFLIMNWGNVDFLAASLWDTPVYLITTGLSGFIVQAFLIWRCHKLSRNYFVTVPLALTALLALGGSLATGVELVKYPLYSERVKALTTVTIWLCASAAVDVLVAVAIVVYLNKIRKTGTQIADTDLVGALKKVTLAAFETGSITAGWAVVVFAVAMVASTEHIAIGLGYPLGRIYSLTMLFNLNVAKGLSNAGAEGESSDDLQRKTFGALSGIPVSRSATVQVEDGRDEPIQLDRLTPAGTKRKLHFGNLNNHSAPSTTFAIGTQDVRDEKVAYNASLDDDHV